jgi:DNA repair exonuclease SbcCD ATPase subunit
MRFHEAQVGTALKQSVIRRSEEARLVLERTQRGLREMPSNAVWLLSRVVRPAGAISGAAAGARDKGRQVAAAVVDAAPVGDSVEIRAARARDAAERAREAEQRAVEAARESKALADRARAVSEHGHAQIKQVARETDRQVKQRVAEAQRAAEELVRRERAAAEAEANQTRAEVVEDVESDISDAESEAEESQHRAEELLEEATRELAEARRLADDAARAARVAAEDAERQAEQLQKEAKQQAAEAEARVKAAEQLHERTVSRAKKVVRELDASNGLDAYNKPELVRLAASMGIEKGSSMRKDELLDVITTAARQRARQASHS